MIISSLYRWDLLPAGTRQELNKNGLQLKVLTTIFSVWISSYVCAPARRAYWNTCFSSQSYFEITASVEGFIQVDDIPHTALLLTVSSYSPLIHGNSTPHSSKALDQMKVPLRSFFYIISQLPQVARSTLSPFVRSCRTKRHYLNLSENGRRITSGGGKMEGKVSCQSIFEIFQPWLDLSVQYWIVVISCCMCKSMDEIMAFQKFLLLLVTFCLRCWIKSQEPLSSAKVTNLW